MYRSVFSAAAALSLLVSTFVTPAVTYAKRRCPDEPPSTLLSLYRKSDAIFVGTFDKTTVGDVISEDEHSTMINVSDHYSISSTLKGTTEKFFVHTYEQYRYKGEDGAEEIEEEGYEYGPKVGDTVLLFLKLAEAEEEDDGKEKGTRELEVVHYRDAVKPVDASELSPFEARIKDLNGIFSSKKVDDADIVRWLLKCIEDPVTRWDGAFELLTSFQSLEWKKEQEAEKEKAEEKSEEENEVPTDTDADAEITGERVEAADEEDKNSEELEVAEEEEEFDNSAYASLLTAEQKDMLTNIAINSKPEADGSENVEIRRGDGDGVLFELVKRWGDSRLAAAMLDRLRVTAENYEKSSWMDSIAQVLKDSELKTLAERYSEISYREDDETIVEKSKPASKDAETKGGEVEEPVSDPEPVADETSEEVHDGPPDKKTYKMLRDELLAQFIDRAQVVITKESEVAKKAEARP
jgi:hypothetical protein